MRSRALPRGLSCLLPLLSIVLLSSGCTNTEPVLSGVEEVSLTPSPRDAVEDYEKPDGVITDVQYLTGKNWSAVRDEVSRQMGDILSSRELSLPDSYEHELERGIVAVTEGTIYQIRVDLDEPMRRRDALAIVGLPPQVDRWGDSHREFRLRNVWSFDRIRMGRIDPYNEYVSWVEVRRWDPRVQSGR